MEATTREVLDAAQRGDLIRGDEGEREPREPDAVTLAEQGKVGEPGAEELDATEWLLGSDEPTEDEIEPVTLRVNVGRPDTPKIVNWKVVPLPDHEFRRFRQMASGNRANRRRLSQGDSSAMDDGLYHRLVVCAATVDPDLKAVAAKKSQARGGIVVDPADVLKHRLGHKPMLIAQISGYVSDISGADEADVEVVAGNS